MKATILYLYENEMPSVDLLREGIKLSKKNAIQTIKVISFREVTIQDINLADVVIMIRPSNVLAYRIALFAKKTKRFLVVNADDDLYNAPQDSILDRSRVKWFRHVLALADLLYTVSPRIAKKYKPLTAGKRCFVGNTIIKEDEILPHIGHNQKVKIVYAAGLSHAPMFNSYIAPILDDLYDEIGNVFSITFVGVHPVLPDLRHRDLEIHYKPMLPMEEYRQLMRRENFDIGLAPLYNDEFSKCKYFNKFFEYARFGIVGVYSNMEPYTYVIENQKNGLLVGFDPQEWLRALKEIIVDQTLRHQMMESSQQTLRNRFNVQACEEEEKKAIPEFYAESSTRKKTHFCMLAFWKMESKVFHAILFLLTALEHLRKHGFQSLEQKLKSHVYHKKIYKKPSKGRTDK